MKPQGRLGLFDRHLADRLPHPFVSFATQFGTEPLVTDRQCEAARTGTVIPGRGPVVGTDIDVIGTLFGQRNGSLGIFDGTSHAVSQQVRRPHQVHKLLVDDPTAFAVEVFGLDEQITGRSSTHGKERRQCKEFDFHGLGGNINWGCKISG